MRRFPVIFCLLVSAVCGVSCGDVTSQTTPVPSSGTPPPSSASYDVDTNVPAGNTAVVLGANFTDPTGTLSLLPINAPRTPVKNIQTTHSDAVVRSYGGLIYVVNRLGGDNVQVVDPADGFAVIGQFSTGQGTNPQDLIPVSGTKAYVSLYQPEDNRSEELAVDDILVMNPQTGEILKTIDLTPFTANDGERFARASDMVKVGGKILVAVQDLGDLAEAADQPGKIVAIDLATDAVSDSVVLSCRDPVAMAYSNETALLYVACADYFHLETSFGGVEVVDPEGLISLGLFVTDNHLGGAPGDIEVHGGRGFVTVGTENEGKTVYATSVVSFSLDVADPRDIHTVYEGAAYIQEIAVDANGRLLVGDRDPAVNGIFFLDAATGDVVDGPVNMGPLPSSIAFVER